MNIEGSVAFVTGANRGLGKAYAEALLTAGAAKVYAGARDPSAITDPRLIPVKLDVTSPEDIAAAAARCGDVNILINNAGAMLLTTMLAGNAEAALRREMEVNVYGPLRMIRAFAPVLAKNGGGAIANMLSVVSWYVFPFNSTYCASKHAALAMTDGLRMELKAQGTQVIGVYAGFIDTDMAAGVSEEKTPPPQVAERTLDGIRNRQDHVLADRSAEEIWAATRNDPAAFAAQMQAIFDAGPTWAA
ncbi:SDR family oxidoreductase [Rhizobium mayense]|uniref:SDR family oxidoreductase n=1 Tax=Rhizobium mayense TaxID=1312184 RepID=A0ABT7K4P9_9HYPH|nr:SDR family oxidoreductase [Rhizobium mayense]MDL2403588.1 SDR family oxidoreductase [Rhizobium mayense]